MMEMVTAKEFLSCKRNLCRNNDQGNGVCWACLEAIGYSLRNLREEQRICETRKAEECYHRSAS